MSTTGATRAIVAASLANLGIAITKFIAFVVSMILFTVGGMLSIYEGINKLQNPNELTAVWLPIVVLSIATVLESFSLRTAMRESNLVRGYQSWVSLIRRSKAPELPVVLVEDLAAPSRLACS